DEPVSRDAEGVAEVLGDQLWPEDDPRRGADRDRLVEVLEAVLADLLGSEPAVVDETGDEGSAVCTDLEEDRHLVIQLQGRQPVTELVQEARYVVRAELAVLRLDGHERPHVEPPDAVLRRE